MDMNIKCPDPQVVGHNFIILYALLYTPLNNLATLAYITEFWQSDYYNHTQLSNSLLITSKAHWMLTCL